MKWAEGEIDGVKFRPVVRRTDHRGWLAEIFRSDEISPGIVPMMSYVSVTHPGTIRGPHGHVHQTDLFGFVGPGNFRLKLWDNRPESPTYGNMLTAVVGEDNPVIVEVPPGVVHGYTNISKTDAWALNFPNRLFRGERRKEPIDEVRYEDAEDSEFSMED